jgi:hypothetical protein
MTLAPPRPRVGIFSRLQCNRNGHHWERQILDSGAEARWVCTTCGKQGDEIPVITPEQEVGQMSEAPDEPTEAAEAAAAEASAEPVAEEPQPAAPDDAPEVVSAAPDDDLSAAGTGRPKVKIGTAVLVTAAIVGLTVFALRRRG